MALVGVIIWRMLWILFFAHNIFVKRLFRMRKRNQTGQRDQSGTLCLRLIPSAFFPWHIWCPRLTQLRGIRIALSFRPYVHPFSVTRLISIHFNCRQKHCQIDFKFGTGIHFTQVSEFLITVTSNEHQTISIHLLLECFIAVCSDWHQRKYQIAVPLSPCAGNPLANSEFPSQRANNAGSVSM